MSNKKFSPRKRKKAHQKEQSMGTVSNALHVFGRVPWPGIWVLMKIVWLILIWIWHHFM